jgi:hypothetical protein
MKRILGLSAACLVLAQGCASSGGEQSGVYGPDRTLTFARDSLASRYPYARLSDCEEAGYFRHTLQALPVQARPGSEVTLHHLADRPAAGFDLIEARCTDQWTVTPPGAATLAQDRRTLEIAPDTEPGSVIVVSVLTGERTASAQIPVIAREALDIAGIWTPAGQSGCGTMPAPPRQLRFSTSGHMSAAWQLFESWWDYHVSYTLDAESGAFSFNAAGGENFPPGGGRQEGQVRVQDQDNLVFTGVFFGAEDPNFYRRLTAQVFELPEGCTIAYRRFPTPNG